MEITNSFSAADDENRKRQEREQAERDKADKEKPRAGKPDIYYLYEGENLIDGMTKAINARDALNNNGSMNATIRNEQGEVMASMKSETRISNNGVTAFDQKIESVVASADFQADLNQEQAVADRIEEERTSAALEKQEQIQQLARQDEVQLQKPMQELEQELEQEQIQEVEQEQDKELDAPAIEAKTAPVPAPEPKKEMSHWATMQDLKNTTAEFDKARAAMQKRDPAEWEKRLSEAMNQPMPALEAAQKGLADWERKLQAGAEAPSQAIQKELQPWEKSLQAASNQREPQTAEAERQQQLQNEQQKTQQQRTIEHAGR